MPRSSFYTQGHGPDVEALKRAFLWLGQHAATEAAWQRVLLAVSQKSNLDGVLEEFLGKGVIKRLKKGEEVSIPPLRLTLLVERDRRTSWDGSVIAVYPSRSLLDKIDSLTGVNDRIVDRDSAVELFEILRDAGLRFSSDDVRALLVSQLGWAPEHANSAERICRDILNGKLPRANRGRWPGALARWKSTAEKSD